MSEEYRPNQDSENNNVDENSNDHQYSQYAYYHNQYTNHQFQRHRPLIDNEQPSIDQLHQENRSNFYQRAGMNRFQGTDDVTDNHFYPRLPNLYHRRNMSDDLSLNSNLPPLPRNSINVDPRSQLLSRFPSGTNHWIPYKRSKPSEEEIKEEARELLYNFASEQFKEENLDPHAYLPNNYSYSNPSWKKTGQDLRKIADEFSKSEERKELRQRAKNVNMSSLTCENFFELCTELFRRGEGGITQERIIVLFTFISDIAIQQVRQKAERFISQLMEWSIRFLFEHICAWVQEAGGWGVVLSRSANIVYKVTLFTCAVFSIVAFGIYIKKNWKGL